MATEYKVPTLAEPAPPKPNEVVLVTSGDLRHTANVLGWPEQQVLEQQIADVLAEIGYTVRRGHEYDPEVEHGFIWNQRMGMDVFATIHPDTPVIIAEAVWEYSHHILSGLKTQRGPILTAANWSEHLGESDSLFVNASTWGLMLTGRLLTLDDKAREKPARSLSRLASRAGEPVIRAAMKQAMKIMGHQFVMGRTIAEAIKRSAKSTDLPYRYSFDMLGESALTSDDASPPWISPSEWA